MYKFMSYFLMSFFDSLSITVWFYTEVVCVYGFDYCNLNKKDTFTAQGLVQALNRKAVT